MIRTCELPNAALLRKYRDFGAYTDCYYLDVPGAVSQAQYIQAFYTTWLFKVERSLLRWFLAKPSTDRQAAALAEGTLDSFAAWQVEGQTADQLLMCDFQGRTRSWLMSEAAPAGDAAGTRLYFGSAVVPASNTASGAKRMGAAFRGLLGFHRIYSRALLRAVAARLGRPA